ncbi:MAG: UDP-N-acetylglucosamine--N-acetylmuramyl-(pentapeptide) pyrophosphoryl-undecaprenol N-acetylglucosamine transferase [Armatimonadetes bacterium]|nr:UDP-N-acetylglucosamine--N-acetylmuramyl-(pentapeptide) pyrophosphoryl-undecaprenol N-acetylglucosamine transferase [Armatimonadota bacterium]
MIVTGGGTGGHVYPAIEVGKRAASAGWRVAYAGSLRGLEGKASTALGWPFFGFNTGPVYSLRTLAGMKGAVQYAQALAATSKMLRKEKPDVVFSTGGYAAGPVVESARKLGIPYVLLEANSVPGRSISRFAQQAVAVATVFRGAEQHFPGCRVERTGLPIRDALRELAAQPAEQKRQVLVVGGSRGSVFLNETVPEAFDESMDAEWLHVSGPDHFEATRVRAEGKRGYTVAPFLEAEAMAKAYKESMVVVARSGSSLAELALFGIPGVLIPLPTSAGDHQLHNAEEFAAMKAATLLRQSEATPQAIRGAVLKWLDDESERKAAALALKEFDVPDATERIWQLVQAGARA